MWNGNNGGGSGGGDKRRSCAACKHQRKSCKESCLMAPHFPGHMTKEFALAHKVFGLSNMAKMLEALDESQRKEAVESFLWEARSWEEDPVNGPYGKVKKMKEGLRAIQERVNFLHHNANHHPYLQPAMLPLLPPPPPPPHSWIGDTNNGGAPQIPEGNSIAHHQNMQRQFGSSIQMNHNGEGGYGIPVSCHGGGYSIPASHPMSSLGINNPSSSTCVANYPRSGRQEGRYNPMGQGGRGKEADQRFDSYNPNVNPDFGYGPVRRNNIQQTRAAPNGNGNRAIIVHESERARTMNCGAGAGDDNGGDHRQQNQMNDSNQANNVAGN